MKTPWERFDQRYLPPLLRARAARQSCLNLIVVALAFSYGHCDGPVAPLAGELIATYGLLLAAWWLSVMLHELGHWAASRVVGLKPIILQTGGGPTLARFKRFGTVFDLGLLPAGGLTLSVGGGGRAIKWRLLCTYLAGPLVNVALLLVSWQRFETRVFAVMTVINGWILVGSCRWWQKPGQLPSDLLRAIALPALPQEHLQELARAEERITFFQLMQQHRYAAALDETTRLLALDAENFAVRAQRSDLLIGSGQYLEADAELERLLQMPRANEPQNTALRAILANNRAWANLILGGAERLVIADHLSEQATLDGPDNPFVQGTRGAVLIELGRSAEGLGLLERALANHHTVFDRATCHAALAIGLARLNRRVAAEEQLLTARTLDPDCELLSRAEAALNSSLEGLAPG